MPVELPKSVSYKNGELVFLDQTKLPVDKTFETQKTVEQVWDSIKKLKLRGAPAIGIAGAYGLMLGLKNKIELSQDQFYSEALKLAEYLDSSRPTAVNLKWALNRLTNLIKNNLNLSTSELFHLIEKEAIKIHNEDKELCRNIGEHGVSLITEGVGVLTHCNAGALAVSELGTALSPLYLAHEKGIKFKVYADETRPLLQGSRLTAWELDQAGIDTTVITDNMAAHLMSEGKINLVIVGTDRVAANGDVANKIGTLGVAILAKHFNIPFYVACPASTIDLNTAKGSDIVIEERSSEEICHFGARRTAPEGIQTRNPAFDVTPHELVTGLITNKGLFTYPYADKLKEVAI